MKHFWLGVAYDKSIAQMGDIKAQDEDEAKHLFDCQLVKLVTECKGCPECRGITYDLPASEVE